MGGVSSRCTIRRLEPADEAELVRLLGAFSRAGYQDTFHPHPLDARTAHEIAKYSGLDYYCCGWIGGVAVAYGMLRGFAEGFPIPSLGIAVHPDYRGAGLAGVMMTHLHQIARSRGAKQIRLKVYENNLPARALYRRFGYVFDGQISKGQLVGFCSP
jgi:ribosomal-protein-alanine N-acetyltransferase